MTSDVVNKACNLKALRSCDIREPFWGLRQSQLPSLQVDEGFFHCCIGTGQQLIDDSLYVCRLQRRKNKLQTLLNSFKDLWGKGGHEQFWRRKLQAIDVHKLSACVREDRHRNGRMLVSAREHKLPSYLWLVAAAAVWRFGLHVHFVSIMGKSNDKLIPAQMQDNIVVIVENHVATLHPENVVDCETIINYCYNTDTPLWIDFAGEAKNPNHNLGSLNFQVQEKLRILQNKHPLTNFGRSSRGKLLDIM